MQTPFNTISAAFVIGLNVWKISLKLTCSVLSLSYRWKLILMKIFTFSIPISSSSSFLAMSRQLFSFNRPSWEKRKRFFVESLPTYRLYLASRTFVTKQQFCSVERNKTTYFFLIKTDLSVDSVPANYSGLKKKQNKSPTP